MTISIFDLFSIGIGPSSSHTVGPMKAAANFSASLAAQNMLTKTSRIYVELYGSLAYTGEGHGTDLAIINGLEGKDPAIVDPQILKPRLETIKQTSELNLNNTHPIAFSWHDDFHLRKGESLPKHSNAMRFNAFDANHKVLFTEVYYSIGGGFIVTETEFDNNHVNEVKVPYPFNNAQELLQQCEKHGKTIAKIMLANESSLQPEKIVLEKLQAIAKVMADCIERGINTHGILPGGLNVKRRAASLHSKLPHHNIASHHEAMDVMNALNIYAMAVNEENAAGGRVVTAPTNGAAGIVPAVLEYLKQCHTHEHDADRDYKIINYLLTAGAIAILFKKNASISGAEVGCQGEVGTASSMAAAGLCAALGGSVLQVENAAEIAMEHHLGMTCDPINGLVQIPCIERNAMGAVKAVNAARLALMEDGEHHVSLDKVIRTMKQTGIDMQTIYKETSQGGLAVNITEC